MSLSPDTLWHFILNNSLRASALIGCILLLRVIAGRRLPAQCFHLLWILAALRLLTPGAPESQWSVFNLFSHPVAEQAGAKSEWQVRTDPTPSAASHLTTFDLPVSAQHAAAPITAQTWLLFVWVTGVGVQISLLALAARRMGRHPATEISDLDTLARRCASQMGLKSAPRIFETGAVAGPAVVGLWRPRMLLPRGLKERLSDEELRFVLLHECAHLRRADLPALWLLTAARVLHWFNPLVWLAARLARVDVELACDETVLRNTNAPVAYGQTILKLAQKLTVRTLALPVIGIVQTKHSIRTRLSRIALYSSPSWLLSWLPAAVILALAGLGFCADEKTPAASQPTSAPEQQKPAWERGWSVVQIEIPGQAKLMDAYVTFQTQAGRLARLSRGILSKEGISISSIKWANEPLEAQIVAYKGNEAATFNVPATLVSSSETLKPKSFQIEVEAKFIEVSDATAKALGIPSPAPNTVRLTPGTPPVGSANVLHEGAKEKLMKIYFMRLSFIRL